MSERKGDGNANALAVALNTAQIEADQIRLGRDLTPIAERILGERGLFLPDVTKHEPFVSDTADGLGCLCGWQEELRANDVESYFEHLAT